MENVEERIETKYRSDMTVYRDDFARCVLKSRSLSFRDNQFNSENIDEIPANAVAFPALRFIISFNGAREF